MKSQARPPVILIGMHRSGTGVLARLLESLGLFVGRKKEKNHEATFFLNINRWLLRQCGTAWDNPGPARYVLEDDRLRAMTADHLRFVLRTPRAASFLGVGKFCRYRSVLKLDIPWGWKDPRNTFTLPVWLDVFPGARVLHISRHGVDVANSLAVRFREETALIRRMHRKFRVFYFFSPLRAPVCTTARCTSLQGGFALWEEYLREARDHVRALAGRAMEIRYEDLLGEPERTIAGVAEFCGLEATAEAISRSVARINPTRAYAYRGDPELSAFAEGVAGRLRALGY